RCSHRAMAAIASGISRGSRPCWRTPPALAPDAAAAIDRSPTRGTLAPFRPRCHANEPPTTPPPPTITLFPDIRAPLPERIDSYTGDWRRERGRRQDGRRDWR